MATAKATTVDTTTTTTHSLFYSNGSAPFASAGITDAAIGLPSAVAWDGTDYWLCAGDYTVTGGTGDDFSTNPLVATDRDVALGGVIANGTQVIFAGRNGKLYNAADWGTTSEPYANSGTAYDFGQPALASWAGTTALLLPSQIYSRSSTSTTVGYLAFGPVSGVLATTTTHVSNYDYGASASNYYITMQDKSIKRFDAFVVDADTTIVFALTAQQGLWSTLYDNGTWTGWRRE